MMKVQCHKCTGWFEVEVPHQNAVYLCKDCSPSVSPCSGIISIDEIINRSHHEFDTGAKRHENVSNMVRYDLISPYALRRVAQVYAHGANKFGDRNWEKGMPFDDLINRIYNHINLHMMGDRSEDHLAHATWNLMAILHFQGKDESYGDTNSFSD